ncbi:MAG TPA: DUF4340 domain-containing protein [Candidatus Binatia bacterium]|jgi:hypothetical protein|nr:DUF4340 domain-containing protein [Candidatus Binatia bacterium]
MKSNILLSFVAVSLVLLAYTERQAIPPTPGTVPEEASELLFSLRPEEIDAVRVLDAHGCVSVRREGTTSRDLEKLGQSIVQARVVRRFNPTSVDLSSYGLTHPVRRVEVKWAHGAQSQRVAIGNLNPVGNAVYAHIEGESDVLLVGSYFLTSLDMALQGLRAEGSKFVDLNCPAGS